MKFDIYWNDNIYDIVQRLTPNKSRIGSYISKSNLAAYTNKTYDDTADEEDAAQEQREAAIIDENVSAVKSEYEARIEELQSRLDDAGLDEEGEDVEPVDQEVIDFWGTGFHRDYYPELERRYKNWTDELPKPLDRATEALYKQVCILEATISRNVSAGKGVEQSVNALNSLLGSLNAKPIQKQQEAQAEAPFDSLPFGVGIKMCENVRPIGETRYKDVDGLKAITHAYLYGHLAKMVGIKNSDCRLYEEEMERMRVAKPEFADESDDDFLADIFEDELTKKIGRDTADGVAADGGAVL